MTTGPGVRVRDICDRFVTGQPFMAFWSRFMDFVGDEAAHAAFSADQLTAFEDLYEHIYMSQEGPTTPEGLRDGLIGEDELRRYLQAFRWESLGAGPV